MIILKQQSAMEKIELCEIRGKKVAERKKHTIGTKIRKYGPKRIWRSKGTIWEP